MSKSISRGVLGLGAVSTAFYLREIHKKYQERNQEFSTCPLQVYQLDFQEVNPFLPNQFKVLIPKLEDHFKRIRALGISKLLIPNITLHETLDQMKIQLEICHPVDLTLKYLKENQISEVYLFGTLYTMTSAYLHSRFSGKMVKLLKPSDSDQTWIDEFRQRVYQENVTFEEITAFQSLIRKYSEKNEVVIACTELSVYSLKENPSCIDMMDLQIEEFLK